MATSNRNRNIAGTISAVCAIGILTFAYLEWQSKSASTNEKKDDPEVEIEIPKEKEGDKKPNSTKELPSKEPPTRANNIQDSLSDEIWEELEL